MAQQTFFFRERAELFLDALETFAQLRRQTSARKIIQFLTLRPNLGELVPIETAIDAQHQQRAIVRGEGVAQTSNAIFDVGPEPRCGRFPDFFS